MSRSALLLFAALALMAPRWSPAAPDLAAALREIRTQGCGGRNGAGPPLQANAILDRVAAALASGARLKIAMSEAGYVAMASAVLEVSGNTSRFGELLATQGCEDILDPDYREFGIAERAGGAWVVLAAPLDAPRAADAAITGREVLALTNSARKSVRRCGWKQFDAAPPLAASVTLERAAAAQARDMANRDVLSHAGRDGSTPGQRAERAGYRWRTVGENIAAGQQSAEQVVSDWLRSPRHCANLMDPDFTEMGVGYAFEPKSPKGSYWAQLFAAPRR